MCFFCYLHKNSTITYEKCHWSPEKLHLVFVGKVHSESYLSSFEDGNSLQEQNTGYFGFIHLLLYPPIPTTRPPPSFGVQILPSMPGWQLLLPTIIILPDRHTLWDRRAYKYFHITGILRQRETDGWSTDGPRCSRGQSVDGWRENKREK